MNTQAGSTDGRTEDMSHWHDLALRRAHALRQEAMDDFWRGANDVLTLTAGAAGRSARRLAQRLARHGRGRAAPVESLPTPGKGD
jgi:hypothetical protein